MMTTLTVSQLNFYIKSLFDYDENLRSVTVRGEISNFNYYRKSGHMYFTLKDAQSAVKAVMFRTDAERLGFVPEDGMSVIVRAKVSVFERDGVYQLYVSDMTPDGLGKQMAAFLQLKDKLEKEGLFDESNKKPIPQFPKKIAVATSPEGAALRDILSVTGRRYPLAEIEIYPCVVQGDLCAPSIIKALLYFNRRNDADVIIIARGGGSYEDLSGFNDEKLARCIAASRIPVINAVGHETDFTIADFAADLRAPTPSAAAERATPDIAEIKAFIEDFKKEIGEYAEDILEEKKESLASADSALNIDSFLDGKELLFERTAESLYLASETVLTSKEHLFAEKIAALHALDPLSVLMRGYAAMYKNDIPVTSVLSVEEGDELTIKMKDGEIICDAKKRNAIGKRNDI